MRKTLIPAALGATMMLGGCASVLNDGLLGDLFGNNDYGETRFERAAVQACGNEASRYGRAEIRSVDQVSRDIVRVRGDIRRDGRTSRFECDFRSDGRIVDFDVD